MLKQHYLALGISVPRMHDLKQEKLAEYRFFKVASLLAQLFRAQLYYDFGRHLATIKQSYLRTTQTDSTVFSEVLDEVVPVYAYYPGTLNDDLIFKAYVGISLKHLKKMVT